MKTNETMILSLLGATVSSFFFGLGQHEMSAQVQNCQISCCEDEYCWWNGGDPPANSSLCSSAQVTGFSYPFGAGANTATAIPSIYVPVPSNPQNCKLLNVGVCNIWTWPSSSSTCQNPDKSFPQPQGVTPMGKATLSTLNANQNLCSPSKISP